MNELEQRLRQVPLKPAPADWRASILAAAKVEQASSLFSERTSASGSFQSEHGIASTPLARTIRELFWPHPKAWAGLAAAWLVILMLHLSQRDESPVSNVASAPPSPEMTAELRQQHQMLAELLGVPEVSVADRPRPKATPHTQVMRIQMV